MKVQTTSGNRELLFLFVAMVAWTWCFVGAPAAVATPGGESVESKVRAQGWESRLFWEGPSKRSAVFIPEDVLAEHPLEQLPVTGDQRWAFLDQVRRFSGYPSAFCTHIVVPPEPEGVLDTFSLVDAIRDTPASFVGEVVSVSPGWSPWLYEVAVLAVVRVGEIVHDRTGQAPEAGDEVGILFRGGRMAYQETVLCDKVTEGLYRPVTGDEILVTGYGWPDPQFFDAIGVFPVEDGLVQPVPYPALKQGEVPRLVESIRTEIREAQEEDGP